MKSKEICKKLSSDCVKHLTPVLKLCGKGSIAYRPSNKAKKLSLSIASDYAEHLRYLADGVMCVYNLRLPKIWERYDHYDSEFKNNCEELVLLNKRKKDFLEAWQKRPGVIRKCKEVIA